MTLPHHTRDRLKFRKSIGFSGLGIGITKFNLELSVRDQRTEQERLSKAFPKC